MNRSEAISVLRNAAFIGTDEDRQRIEQAIDTLDNAQPDSNESSLTQKALDTIDRQAAIDALIEKYPFIDPMSIMWVISNLPSAQPETHEERTETHGVCLDAISRQAAIEAFDNLEWFHQNANKDMVSGANSAEHQAWYKAEDVYRVLEQLPSAQPEHTNSWCINSWCIDCKEYDQERHCCPRYNRVIKQTLDEVYAHAETEAESRFHAQQRWIPCSERLPEPRMAVLGYAPRYQNIYAGLWVMYMPNAICHSS